MSDFDDEPLASAEGTVATFPAAPDPVADAIHGFAHTYTPAGRLETRTGPLAELTTWSWSGGLPRERTAGV